MADGACCAGLLAVGAKTGLPCFVAPRQRLKQEEFEALITYLAAVPIFRKQLPRAELPKVAEAFKEKTWSPGETVVKQGEDGRAFFIVKSGEALVVVTDEDGMASDRATLYALDYFGGHTLTEKRANVATILAKGPEPLVTLSMSRSDFEALGLNKIMKFPRRPAIYEGRPAHATTDDGDAGAAASAPRSSREPLTPEEAAFLQKALRASANLRRALGDISDSQVRRLAQEASLRRIPAGACLGQSGEILKDFFVVVQGSFDVLPCPACSLHSVEGTVSLLAKAQKRLLLKEEFVASLEQQAQMPSVLCGRASSVKVRPTELTPSARRAHALRTQSLAGYKSLKLRLSQVVTDPFQAGDRVARIVVMGENLHQEAGEVVEVLKHGGDGEVLVAFDGASRRETVKVNKLRPCQAIEPIATLKAGMCFGELCLLYNTRLLTTCRAREASVVYAINRFRFKECFSREGPHLEEHIRLLDEVHLLSGLLRAERWELARSAAGVIEFKPGESVLQQGQLGEPMLYIVKSGSCVMWRRTSGGADGEATREKLATLQRGGHFGERAILRGETTADFSVDAGPHGLSCLTIHGQIVKAVLANIYGAPGAAGDHEYMELLNRPATTPQRDIPLASLEVLGLLGEGGFGSVFHVRGGDEEFALKRLSKGFMVQENITRQVRLERDILSMVDSNFIIKLYRTYKDAKHLYFLLELCAGGHLFQLMTACRRSGRASLLPEAVMFYVASISLALGHMHERKIAYRDLKAENVLLDGKGYVKVCDMGFAKFVVDKTHTLLGTPDYMAPEMIDPPHAHDYMVDWWALGVLTFELLTGQTPWYNGGIDADADPMAQLLAIRDSHDDGFPERLIPRSQTLAKDFVKRLLTTNPRKRLGRKADAADLRQDPWFVSTKFDFSALLAQAMPPPEAPETSHHSSSLYKLQKSVELAAEGGTADQDHEWEDF